MYVPVGEIIIAGALDAPWLQLQYRSVFIKHTPETPACPGSFNPLIGQPAKHSGDGEGCDFALFGIELDTHSLVFTLRPAPRFCQ